MGSQLDGERPLGIDQEKPGMKDNDIKLGVKCQHNYNHLTRIKITIE